MLYLCVFVCTTWFKSCFFNVSFSTSEYQPKISKLCSQCSHAGFAAQGDAERAMDSGRNPDVSMEELVASTIWLSWRTIVAWIHIVWNLISDLTFGHGKDTGPQPMQTEDWRCSRTAVAKFRSFWEYDRCLVFLKVLLLVLEHLAHRRRLL